MPILCNYYVTYRCNAFCGFCHFGDHARYAQTKHADTDIVLRNLPALKKIGVRFIDFTGGEPLLHPDIAVLTGAAHELGMKTSITTNGLLYPKFAEALRGSVYLLHFSLDGARADTHDVSRGVACFDRVIESIRLARSLGEFPDLLFTVTDTNVGEIEDVYALAREHGLILVLNPVFEYFRKEDLSDTSMAIMTRMASKPGVYLNPSFLTLRRQGGNDPANPSCRAVSRVVVISPENEILLPCYHHHFEALPIGDDLAGAWKSERVRWHRSQEGRHAFCAGCTINCYFEPSFSFPIDALSLASVPSKVKYGYHKLLRQGSFRNRLPGRDDS